MMSKAFDTYCLPLPLPALWWKNLESKLSICVSISHLKAKE